LLTDMRASTSAAALSMKTTSC